MSRNLHATEASLERHDTLQCCVRTPLSAPALFLVSLSSYLDMPLLLLDLTKRSNTLHVPRSRRSIALSQNLRLQRRENARRPPPLLDAPSAQEAPCFSYTRQHQR